MTSPPPRLVLVPRDVAEEILDCIVHMDTPPQHTIEALREAISSAPEAPSEEMVATLNEARELITRDHVSRKHGGCSACWHRDTNGDLISGHRDRCIIAKLAALAALLAGPR